MKKKYIPPVIEIYEYKVEHGYAWSGTITDDDNDDIVTGGCGCKGWDCTCSKRSQCKGSGIDGCRSKNGLSNSFDDYDLY